MDNKDVLDHIAVTCSVCGNELNIMSKDWDRFVISPCMRCTDHAFGAGFQQGKEQSSRPLRFVE